MTDDLAPWERELLTGVRTLDIQDIMRILLRIVGDFGSDYCASGSGGESGCTYFRYDNGVLVPVCIVGQVFARLGIMFALFENPDKVLDGDHGGQYGSCSMKGSGDGAAIRDRAQHMGFVFTNDAWEVLRSAQSIQDLGDDTGDYTWGTAVKYAIRELHQNKVQALPTFELLREAEAAM